jgi:hypothetical protein
MTTLLPDRDEVRYQPASPHARHCYDRVTSDRLTPGTGMPVARTVYGARREDRDRVTAHGPFPRPKMLDAGGFPLEVRSFRLHLAAAGKAGAVLTAICGSCCGGLWACVPDFRRIGLQSC